MAQYGLWQKTPWYLRVVGFASKRREQKLVGNNKIVTRWQYLDELKYRGHDLVQVSVADGVVRPGGYCIKCGHDFHNRWPKVNEECHA